MQILRDTENRIFVIISPIKLRPSSHFAQLATVHGSVRMIKNVKLSNTKEHDGISSDLLKLMGNAISKSITLIINQSLRTDIIPDKLKIAKVIPIFKKDSKKLIKNYRSIYMYVLPVRSKIFERAIHEQLSNYFTTINLFFTR